MMNKKNIAKAVDFDEALARELKNPEFKKLFDEYGRQLELSYGLLKLRKQRQLSQAELAAKIGTTQGNIARLESGRQNFTISFLGRVVDALGAELKITLR
ncbi:MAG: helix-turn-helix transcriptional regulator [Patescibacteria group bacterium]